jgi:hypothetical protein
MSTSAGKGSRPRPVKGEVRREDHEMTFPKATQCEANRGEVIDGHRCLCAGCWQTVNQREQSLRDAEET